MRIIFAQTLTKRNIELTDREGNIQWFSRDFNSNLEVDTECAKSKRRDDDFRSKIRLISIRSTDPNNRIVVPAYLYTSSLSIIYIFEARLARIHSFNVTLHRRNSASVLRHIFARKGAHVAEKDSPGTVFFIYRRRVSRWKTWRKRRILRFSSPLAYSLLYAFSREIVSSWIRNCRGALRVSRPWNEINIFSLEITNAKIENREKFPPSFSFLFLSIQFHRWSLQVRSYSVEKVRTNERTW